MPRVKIEDREYGLGADVEALPEDPRGYGPRAAGAEEYNKLVSVLEAFGFETSRTIHNVYVIEGNSRRQLTLAGDPVTFTARSIVDIPVELEPIEDVTPPSTAPAEETVEIPVPSPEALEPKPAEPEPEA